MDIKGLTYKFGLIFFCFSVSRLTVNDPPYVLLLFIWIISRILAKQMLSDKIALNLNCPVTTGLKVNGAKAIAESES